VLFHTHAQALTDVPTAQKEVIWALEMLRSKPEEKGLSVEPANDRQAARRAVELHPDRWKSQQLLVLALANEAPPPPEKGLPRGGKSGSRRRRKRRSSRLSSRLRSVVWLKSCFAAEGSTKRSRPPWMRLRSIRRRSPIWR
jgi:hypothetical protein